MWATVTSKGQVTVPKPVREALRLVPGSAVDFVEQDGMWTVRRATRSIKELKGAVPAPPQPVTIDDMNTAVASGAAETMH
jgi:AbrB family looped-hinge helix DNA binding protein